MKRTHLIRLLSSATMLAGIPNAASAQDISEFRIEEITVTARRRAESLDDVPGTVSTLSAATLQDAGVNRASDFISLIAGVTLVDAAEVGDTQVNIRGINGARDAENSFAFVLDGILYTNPAAFNREYSALSQIEVFKGPQGAIYGRNAAAGAIIVSTEKPDGEEGGRINASFAEDNTALVKGYYTGSLGGKTYFSVGADYRRSDGFFRNRFQNNSSIVDRFEGGNVNLRLVNDFSETISLDTKFRYGEVDAGSIVFNSTFALPVFAEGTNTPAAFQDVNDFDFVFDSNIPSDNDQSALEASTKLTWDMEDITLTAWVLYSDIKNNLISDGTSAAFGFYAGDSACQASAAALTGTPLLAPQFIGQTPNGVIFDPNGSFLGAYTPTTCDGIQEQVRNQKDISAELRIESAGDGPFRWALGAYFLNIDRQVGVSLNRDSGEAPIRGLLQLDGPNQTAALVFDDFDSRVFAFFGQFSYDVTEDIELSAALRYDNENRQVSSLVPFDARQNVIDLNFDGVFDDPLNPALSSLINPSGVIEDQERTFSELQPKVSLTYDVTEEVTLFASWGVGFKAGGFNNSGSAATVNIFNNSFINGGIGINFADQLGNDLPLLNDFYDEETSSAFEAGFKGTFLDGRLRVNGAGYFTRVDDMQFFEFFVGTFGLLRVVSNIDEVDIYGAELDVNFAITPSLNVFAAGNYTDSEIGANSSRPDTVGNQAPYTAEYTLNGGFDFRTGITNDVDIFLRADAQLVGPTWFHTVQEGQRSTIFQPLFELGFGPGAGALGIADYSVARRDEYATVNLRAGVAGGDGWTVTAFVTNLFDERFLEEVIPAPEFGGTFNAPGALRRFGIEFDYQF